VLEKWCPVPGFFDVRVKACDFHLRQSSRPDIFRS
jgi:hypothetical protein